MLLTGALLAGGCRAPEAPLPSGGPKAAGHAAEAGADGGGPRAALRIVSVTPPPGTIIPPRTRFEVRFDRDLDPASIGNRTVNCDHPDPRAELVGDPFRFTASWVGDDPAVVHVQPPDLLVGRDVRLLVREGVRAKDGTPLLRDPSAPPGLAAIFEYRVLELP